MWDTVRLARMSRAATLPALSFAGVFRHHFQLQLLRVPQDGENTACSHRGIGQQTMQVVHARDRFAIHSDDYVAFPQSCFLRRAPLLHRGDDHAALTGEIVEAHDAAKQRHGLGLDADVTAADSALTQQSSGNELRGIDSDGETQSLRAHDGRRVHAHHAPVGAYERTTGIARVERSVGLNYIFDQPPGVGAQRTSQSTDDAGGDRVLKSIRIADGNGQLAYAKSLRVSERSGHEMRSVIVGQTDTNHGQIGRGIVADNVGREALPVGERDINSRRAVYHMAVGQYEAIRREYKSRTAALTLTRLAR